MDDLDFLDLMLAVIIYVIFLPLIVFSLKEQDRLQQARYSVEDKNVQLNTTVYNDPNISGKDYNAWEVLLTTQIQSYYMANPKTLSVMGEIGGKESYLKPIDVTATFNADRDVFVEQFRDQMSRVGGLTQTVAVQGEDGSTETLQAVARYTLKLNQGYSLSSEDDNFYYFRKVE